jgi:hypothetical protein
MNKHENIYPSIRTFKYTDTEMLDFLQRSPNPRLRQLNDSFHALDGGVRGTIEDLIEKYKGTIYE